MRSRFPGQPRQHGTRGRWYARGIMSLRNRRKGSVYIEEQQAWTSAELRRHMAVERGAHVYAITAAARATRSPCTVP